jgi:hypothetical protein
MEVNDIDFNLTLEEVKCFVKEMLIGEKQVFETIHTTKDGKKIPVEISQCGDLQRKTGDSGYREGHYGTQEC